MCKFPCVCFFSDKFLLYKIFIHEHRETDVCVCECLIFLVSVIFVRIAVIFINFMAGDKCNRV